MKMNNRGYTILATLVGLVLVSLSARALLSLTQSSLKSGLAMDRMSAVPRLAGNLELILRDHASCANALKVKHASGNTENSYFHPAVKASQKGVINKIVFSGR
jgi:type II secretory pathway component PulJ